MDVCNLRIVTRREAAGGAMATVEAIFEVNSGLSNEVVAAKEIPVEDLDVEDGVLGEGCLEFKHSESTFTFGHINKI